MANHYYSIDWNYDEIYKNNIHSVDVSNYNILRDLKNVDISESIQLVFNCFSDLKDASSTIIFCEDIGLYHGFILQRDLLDNLCKNLIIPHCKISLNIEEHNKIHHKFLKIGAPFNVIDFENSYFTNYKTKEQKKFKNYEELTKLRNCGEYYFDVTKILIKKEYDIFVNPLYSELMCSERGKATLNKVFKNVFIFNPRENYVSY
ncbi:MAG: hypothetical protein ACRBFS_26270 [Aureispira sp.]